MHLTRLEYMTMSFVHQVADDDHGFAAFMMAWYHCECFLVAIQNKCPYKGNTEMRSKS